LVIPDNRVALYDLMLLRYADCVAPNKLAVLNGDHDSTLNLSTGI